MPRLPLDIVETVVDILTQEDDSNFTSIKACALVCHDFLPINRKRIFASLSINDRHAHPSPPYAYIHKTTSSRFRELLTTSPKIADYIRNLKYCVREKYLEDDALIASLKSMTRLQSLTIWKGLGTPIPWNWSTSRSRTAFLHLFRLPTFNDLSLCSIHDFIVADLPLNLKNFKFQRLRLLPAPPPSAQIKIYAMSIGCQCSPTIKQLYEARTENGEAVIDLTSLNSLESELYDSDDVEILRNLLGHCTGLAHVKIKIVDESLSFVGLNKMLSPSLETLKHLQTKAILEHGNIDPYCGIADELELMNSKNVIEIIDIQITISTNAECPVGDKWGRLDSILTQSAWPCLRRVILSVILYEHWHTRADELAEVLKVISATQFKGISSRETMSFEFNFSEDWF